MGKNKQQNNEETPEQLCEEEIVSGDETTEAAAGLSAEEQLQLELEKTKQESLVFKDQYVRTMAEMENLRKRTQREKEEQAKFANESILRDILPVIDNLERAVEHAEQGETQDGLLEGVKMTLTQFSQVLDRFGVEPIEAAGQPFNSEFHQAMGQLETDEVPANNVAQQMQKGYLLNGRLLRPAFVMVAKAPQVPEASDASDAE